MSHQLLERFLDKHINFSQAHREQGSLSQTHIREVLDNKSDNDIAFPWLTTGDFLSGSYARGTKIHPLDDIDIMVVLDGTGLFVIENNQIQNIEVRGSGIHGSPVMDLKIPLTELISPKRILEVFQEGLKETYPDSEIKRDGRAINVWLDSYGLGIDIIPCFHLIPRNGSQEYFFIPKGENSHEWVKTNPKIDIAICNELNDIHDKKLKPVIRLIKYWNRTQNGDRLKSYHLEVLIWKVFHLLTPPITTYPEALKYFFNNVELSLSQKCPDLLGLSEDVDAYLSYEDRQASLNKVREARQIINTSNPGLLLPSQGSSWKRIFGPEITN